MNIEHTPHAAWLEEVVRIIFEKTPVSMAFVATLEGGDTLTGYFNADAQDKAVFAHHIQSDIIMEIIENNAGLIRETLEGAENADHP